MIESLLQLVSDDELEITELTGMTAAEPRYEWRLSFLRGEPSKLYVREWASAAYAMTIHWGRLGRRNVWRNYSRERASVALAIATRLGIELPPLPDREPEAHLRERVEQLEGELDALRSRVSGGESGG